MASIKQTAINNERHVTQAIDYAGFINAGAGGFIDIDSYQDWKRRAHIIVEVKRNFAAMNKGQRVALENLVDDLKRPAILMVVTHNQPEGAIDLAGCRVDRYRSKGVWHRPKKRLNALELVQKFQEYVVKQSIIDL